MYHVSDTTQSRYVSTDANLFYNRSTPACTVIETVIRISPSTRIVARIKIRKEKERKKKINFKNLLHPFPLTIRSLFTRKKKFAMRTNPDSYIEWIDRFVLLRIRSTAWSAPSKGAAEVGGEGGKNETPGSPLFRRANNAFSRDFAPPATSSIRENGSQFRR